MDWWLDWWFSYPISTLPSQPRPSLVQGERGFCGHETKGERERERQDIEEVDQVVPLPSPLLDRIFSIKLLG